MAHSLFRLTERLCNKPQLIAPQKLAVVVDYLFNRNIGNAEMKLDSKPVEKREPTYNQAYKSGLLPVVGSLTNIEHYSWCDDSTSYEGLVGDTERLIQLGAQTIVLDIDSGGGEAYGCFEAANRVRQLANDAGVKIIAYVDGSAYSAAYAWAAIADEVVVNPMAGTGSIGVVVQLWDVSEAMAKEGYKRVFVYAGDAKIPYDADGKFRADFIAEIQESVDESYEMFVDHIASHRSMSRDAVKATQAKTFNANKSVELGLADKIMTKQEFLDYVFA